MPPEQIVELEIVRRRVIVAVPPAPVAAFRDQDLLPCARQVRGRARGFLERGPGVRELTPRALVVLMADPDVEISIDPRPRKDVRQLPRCSRARLGDSDAAELGMCGQASVERSEERTTAACKVLPGVF